MSSYSVGNYRPGVLSPGYSSSRYGIVYVVILFIPIIFALFFQILIWITKAVNPLSSAIGTFEGLRNFFFLLELSILFGTVVVISKH